uniref:Uncharacterized protein LOC111100407 isoform X2 n=1 Tax=Crassostrea virginica TaxID=6565 RepID=A0A8B8ABW7_CRAVI|nr:uncharacterized protein LOC111100407 isoform X2 [Crassostrea virginica]
MELFTFLRNLILRFLIVLVIRVNTRRQFNHFSKDYKPKLLVVFQKRRRKLQNKIQSNVCKNISVFENPFKTLHCYATIIPPLFGEDSNVASNLDVLRNGLLEIYVEEENDGANQSLVEQLRIEQFRWEVSQNDYTNLLSDLNYRIATFKMYYTHISALKLARNGWYYCTLCHETRCYVCGEKKAHWSCDDQPDQCHSRGCRMGGDRTQEETVTRPEEDSIRERNAEQVDSPLYSVERPVCGIQEEDDSINAIQVHLYVPNRSVAGSTTTFTDTDTAVNVVAATDDEDDAAAAAVDDGDNDDDDDDDDDDDPQIQNQTNQQETNSRPTKSKIGKVFSEHDQSANVMRSQELATNTKEGNCKNRNNLGKYHEPDSIIRIFQDRSNNISTIQEQPSQSSNPRLIDQNHHQRSPFSENLELESFRKEEREFALTEDILISDPQGTQSASLSQDTFNGNHNNRQTQLVSLKLSSTAVEDNRTPSVTNSPPSSVVSATQRNEAQLEALKRDPMGINFDRPKYPTYAVLAVRISSFTAWPASMTQTPRDMAIAGFFFAGYGDYTRCFFCGGGLRNWEPGDDPWVEHARWFPKCAFVRQNRGQDFIDLVQRRAAEQEEQRNEQGTGNTQNTTNSGEELSEQASEEKVMRSPAVTTIKEMGYSEDRIKAAIFTLKQRLPRGKHKVSAHDILEVIFELNQSKSSSPINQSESIAENSAIDTGQSNSVMENSAYNSGGHSNLSEEQKLQSANDPDSSEAANSELTSLKMENSSLKDQILCKICMEKNVSIAFLPCGHLACCEDCSPAMRKCPICRQFVRGTVKIFSFD